MDLVTFSPRFPQPGETVVGSRFLTYAPKSYILEDTTMYIRREAYMIEFFAYETLGGTIGHTSGLSRADFI